MSVSTNTQRLLENIVYAPFDPPEYIFLQYAGEKSIWLRIVCDIVEKWTSSKIHSQ